MPPDPEREERHLRHEGGAPKNDPVGGSSERNGSTTTAEQEALVFAGAARGWLDHGLIGDVELTEALDAAGMLLDRASVFAAAA